MSHPLIDRLSEELGYAVVSADSLDGWLGQQEHSVVFLSGEIERYPEATDVAVVLPELIQAFGERLTPAVAEQADHRELARRLAIVRWPALVFFRGDKYLDIITKIQDWSDYLQEIEEILAGEVKRPPGIGIPVITA
jgi:hydrogenase-1 operon protein HyaE